MKHLKYDLEYYNTNAKRKTSLKLVEHSGIINQEECAIILDDLIIFASNFCV